MSNKEANYKEKRYYIECMCGDPDHIVIVDVIDWKLKRGESDVEMHLSAILPHTPHQWWKRILPAIRYLFGKSKRQHFEEKFVTKRGAEQLKRACEQFVSWRNDARKRYTSS